MRRLTKPNDANKLQLVVFTKFFLEIKIEILFDKREIHVQTQQPCKHKYSGTKTCSTGNKICNKINTAHGHRIQKQQQVVQLPPIGTNYAENPEPVLQKTKYTTTKYNPWTYITETITDITLSTPVSTDYAEIFNLFCRK